RVARGTLSRAGAWCVCLDEAEDVRVGNAERLLHHRHGQFAAAAVRDARLFEAVDAKPCLREGLPIVTNRPVEPEHRIQVSPLRVDGPAVEVFVREDTGSVFVTRGI